jgi:hypothetical protein
MDVSDLHAHVVLSPEKQPLVPSLREAGHSRSARYGSFPLSEIELRSDGCPASTLVNRPIAINSRTNQLQAVQYLLGSR